MNYIHPEAKLHSSVQVGPFTCIHGDVEIGEGTIIDNNVTIYDGVRIGKNCHIYSGAVIGGDPQDLKYKGEKTYAIIGDNTTNKCNRFIVFFSRKSNSVWQFSI